MDSKKPPTEREMGDSLKEGRRGITLPPLQFRLRKTLLQFENQVWDFELEGIWADQKVAFVADYKSLSTPKAFEEALRRLQYFSRPPKSWPLMLVPYLRLSQLEQLEELGISGIDLCGNGVVITDAIRIFRTGQPNRFSLSAPIKNIYRHNTSMVARLFTAVPKFPSVGAIREEINARNPFVRNNLRTPMQLSTVSKALKGLEEDLMIVRSDTIRLLQAEKLLEELVGNYEPPKPTRRIRIKLLSTGPKLWKGLGDRLKGVSAPTMATGLSSVRKYADRENEELISLYCSRIDSVRERLEGTETDRFPNVELIETEEEPLFFDACTERGFAWASPLQAYLELMTGDKREHETTDQVKALLLRNMK